MNVLFDSTTGPVEGFTEASFQIGVGAVGSGSVTADPTVEPYTTLIEDGGRVTCRAEGAARLVWTVEDVKQSAEDTDDVTLSGRGRAADLAGAIVLPAGYPSHTSRDRTETGTPLGVWLTLLTEAQGRGRLGWLTPTFTATHDSDGTPWAETVDVELEPGVQLDELLDEMCEVEDAEWVIDTDGNLTVSKNLGADRSGEVVLFVGRDQVRRSTRVSRREARGTVYVESSTGVSSATNTTGAGELWIQAEDFADPTSRAAVATRLAETLGTDLREVEVAVGDDCGLFDTFQVGDRVGLDLGDGTVETVRVVAATVKVDDQVTVELTLVSAVELWRRRMERAIEAKADVRLAASATIQRRHGLVKADKILSGSLQVETEITSDDYVAGSSGFRIAGDGNAELNDLIARGTLESHNFQAGTSGWRIVGDGNAEFNGVVVRGSIQGSTITGSNFETNPGTNNNNVKIGTDQPGRITWNDSSGGWTYMQSDGGDARIYTSGGAAALFVDNELMASRLWTDGRYVQPGSTDSVDAWLGANGQLTSYADGSVGSHAHSTPDHTHALSL